MPVLVKFCKDWSDEFDVYGFKIFNSIEEWNKALETIKEEEEFFFGTNEGWEEGEIDEDDFTVTNITAGEAFIIESLFGNKFGIFP